MAKKKNNDLQAILNGTYKSSLARDNDIAPVKKNTESVKNDTAVKKTTSSKNDLQKILDGEYKSNLAKSKSTTQSTIQSNKDDNKKWYQKIFTKGEFEDGYDFGDVTKTILGTGTDVYKNVSKGALNVIEGIVDIGANAVATGQNLLGFDEASEKTRKFADKDLSESISSATAKTSPIGIMYNLVNGKPTDFLNPYGIEYDKDKSVIENIKSIPGQMFDEDKTEDYEKSSVSGYYADKTEELVGYTLALIFGGNYLSGATGTATTGSVVRDASGKIIGGSGATLSGGNIGLVVKGHALNLPTLAFTGGMSSGLQEANQKEGVTESERWAKALSSGGIEALTESLFGMFGVGGNEFTDKLGEKAASKFTSKAGKVLATVGVKSSGEAAEEFLSYAGNYLVDNNIIDKIGDADFSQEWDWGEVGEQMALAFASSLITQGGGTVLETNSAIASAEDQLGRKLTNEEKAEVTQASIEGTLEEKLNKLTSTNEDNNIAPVVNQTQNEELGQQNNEVSNTITQQEQTNSLVDVPSNTLNNVNTQQNQQLTNNTQTVDNTQVNNNEAPKGEVITKSIEELKTDLENTKGFLARGKVQEQINALENGFNTVEEYRAAEEIKKNERIKAKEEETLQKQKAKEQQEIDKKNKLNKEIEEATPLKREQYKIVQENNPMNDELHVGIRSPKDIKTFDEVIEDEESFVWGDFNKEDAQKALDSGEITIYSSYPIEQGVFVSTSLRQAQEYAGGDANKVYSKTVPLNEVAWISGDEGQYAKVSNESLNEKTNSDVTTNQSLENVVQEQVEEAIAPVKEELTNTINELKETVSEVKQLAKETKALTEEDLPMLEQQYKEAPVQDVAPIRNNLTQEESEELDALDIYEDISQFNNKDLTNRYNELSEKENNYFNENNETTIESPLEEEGRDFSNVGKRSVKAYQYEHPEVRPYFQEEAGNLLWELENTTKGERYIIGDTSQMGNGDYQYSGTKRYTSPDIAYLLDEVGMPYSDIEKGLNAIIEDNGSENIAASKKIELIIDDRLRNGYTRFGDQAIYFGKYAQPNQGYINLIQANNWNDYYNSIPGNDIAPIDNNLEQDNVIAPIKENIANNTVKERYEAISPRANENIDDGGKMIRVSPEMEKNDLGYIPQNPTKASSYENLTDTSEETVTNQQVAQILDTEPKTNNQRNKRKWAIFKANVFDKGMVFEDLSLKTKNRDLMGKWDYTLTSEARGQNVIGEGHYESDPVTKERVQTSKSLNDIRAEVDNTGKTKEFYDYIYHKHNVDRMNLANRFEGMENKPVFGDSVTSEVSQQIVNQYENTNPEFIDYAQDVYNYLNADRQELVKAGVISQETADLWQEMYPHYVPVRRVSDTGLDINVPLDTQRTGINAPIKQATGGSSDILPLFDTMAQRTLQTYRATAKNNFGVELKNTLNSTVDTQQTNVDEVIDSVDNQEELLQENNGKPTFTVFENGEKVTFSITMDMYDALKPLSDSSILSKTITPLNKMSNFHRGVLTEYNPVFMLTNAVKDAQDVLINSQHAAKTYLKIPEAYAQLIKKGYWYQEYVSNGGEQNSYFDSQENTFKTENKGLAKLLDLPPLSTISKLNNFIEMTPRLAEYIASRESGRSVEVSMLDAARVTTNFKAGGNLTKFLNRNGATFLNASMQGAMQQVRNIREAKMNGLKGWATLAGKFTAASLPAILLNGLIWKDDEDYEELSDYVKQNYYIVAKKDDGTFIRIPKGRTVAVIQNAVEQVQKVSSGDDEADLKEFIDLALNNLAPNNPIENNILSPIVQVANNKTWYGGDLVPTRLQDLPAEEQYDESTDMFSRWFGETFNVSPMKVNYLLDQYTGGVGDVVLPMMTPEATSDADTLGEQLLAPLKSKFTTNSTMNNQNISDFYDTKEELTTNAKKKGATDEDVLKNKFFNSVNSEISDLYTEKREIQNSDLSKGEKYNKILEIQNKINVLAKTALSDYEDVNISGNYATVGDVQFKLNTNEDGETYWNKITDKQITKQEEVSNGLGISASEYWSNKDEYDDAFENPKKYAVATAITDYDTYKEYTSNIWDLKADKDENGNSISGTKKTKVISYVNSLDLSIPQKAMLIRQQYSTFDDYNNDIVDYVSNLNVDYETKKIILEGLDFEVDDDGNVYW